MIIAIDESGSFGVESSLRSFFIAVHIRQRKTFYKIKRNQFAEWEGLLPKSLKNSKGEIKSSSLSDEQLTNFARKVIVTHFRVGITPFIVRPVDNPVNVIEKHRQVHLMGIQDGVNGYTHQGKSDLARIYDEFGNWLQNLSYPQYLKILVLGE